MPNGWGAAITSAGRAIAACSYYNQPRRHSNYLSVAFVLSHRDGTLATFRRALTVLDEVARLKRTDAILCDAWNWRISDRLAARWGWEPHKPQRWHRNFIKRFYGVYPQPAAEVSAAGIASDAPSPVGVNGGVGKLVLRVPVTATTIRPSSIWRPVAHSSNTDVRSKTAQGDRACESSLGRHRWSCYA